MDLTLRTIPGMDPISPWKEGLPKIRGIAEDFQRIYKNGLQKIHLRKVVFEDLVKGGIILRDIFYSEGSIKVPPLGLPEFNEAIKKGTPNSYEPEALDEPKEV